MKAAQFKDYGDPSVMVITEVEKPVAGPGQVMVEVQAASINPFDDKLRAGAYKAGIHLNLPVTSGGDLAGVVAGVGDGVEGLRLGDRVYGQAAVVAGNSGAFAEFAVTRADQLAVAPSKIDMAAAAALPLVGVSALQALTVHLKLERGQKLLIQGGTGGIGQVAVQLAKHLGAQVAVTTSAADADFARELGADVVMDYAQKQFEEVVQDFDAVFDTVGGDVFERSLKVLKRGGVAVSMGPADSALAAKLGVTAIGQHTKVNTDMLDKLRVLVDDGVVKVRIDSTFALGQVQEAFEKFEHGARGKVVLSLSR